MNNVVNDDYVDQSLSTLFVKWFLNDDFVLLCGLSNCYLHEHILLLWRFKLLNVVVNFNYVDQSLSTLFVKWFLNDVFWLLY